MLAIIAAGGPIAHTVQSAGYIGMNLERFSDYSDSRVFVDILMTSRSFAPQGDPYAIAGDTTADPTLAPVRADGWPSGDFAICIGDDLNLFSAGTGTYEGSYTGTTIATSITGSACTVQNHRSVGGGVYRFEVVLTGSKAPYLSFSGIPANFADLRLIRPGYAWDTNKVFTDEWLAMVAPYSVIRTMNVTRTSEPFSLGNAIYTSGGQTNWASRWTDTSTPAGKIWRRHTWEMVAQIANATGKDIWVCIPHRATDDYMTGMFNTLHALVNPGIKIWVEYSNEIWNTSPAFQPQYGHCQTAAQLDVGMFGGTNIAADITSASIASNVVTLNCARNHGRTTGDTILAKLGESGSMVWPGAYVVTVTSPTQLTFTITGGVDGTISMSQYNTFVAMNASSDLVFDFTRGYDGSGNCWTEIQNQYYWGWRYGAKRLAAAKNALAAIDPSLIKTRFKFVAAGQFASTATFGQAWMQYLAKHHGPVSSWLSAVSAAPYTSSNTSDTTVPQVLSTLTSSRLVQKALYPQWLALGKSIGAEFIPYEIGTDLFVQASTNATLANNAGNDAGITPIVTELLLDAARMGAPTSNFYSFGAGHSGSGFLLRKSFESTVGNDPRFAGMTAALASPVPALDDVWTATAVPTNAGAPDYSFSGYPLYGPDLIGGLSGAGSGNVLFAGGNFSGAIKPRFVYVHYVSSDGQWDLNWQLGINDTPVPMSLFIDNADTGVDITPNQFATVDGTACTDLTPVRLTITKGWHVFKVEADTASYARFGARQFKLTPAL